MRRALILPLFLAMGCSGIEQYTSVAMLKDFEYEPTTEVDIFVDREPPRAYDVIAKLETQIEPGAPLGDLYKSMRERAKEIGADAVIEVQEETQNLSNVNNSYNWYFGSTMTSSTERLTILRGKAVKYK